MQRGLSTSNIRHLHISNVQVGPDFIHRLQPQFAGIQDELQLFNGCLVLLPVAPGHIFPSTELLQQTPAQILLLPSASSVSQREQLTEGHQQVVVWMQPSSKISSQCSACICMLFNIAVLLILVCSCTHSHHWGQVRNWYVCYLLCPHKMIQRGPVLNRVIHK